MNGWMDGPVARAAVRSVNVEWRRAAVDFKGVVVVDAHTETITV